MNLLYAYSDKRLEDQKETRRFIQLLKETHPEIKIYEAKGINDYDYEEMLIKMIELNDDFMIIEQDIVPTLEQFLEIANSPEPICSAKYYLYPKSTLLKEPVLASRSYISPDPHSNFYTTGTYKWSNINDSYSDLMSFGLCKFKKESIPYIENFKRIKFWRDLDNRISNELLKYKQKIHLHSVVKHNHQ